MTFPRLKANGLLKPAQESGCPLSNSFTDPNHYWANHSGVMGTLTTGCIRLHDSYWTLGPDGKVYATWHPEKVLNHPEAGNCYFGHEHGDNPLTSPFYTDVKYAQQRSDGMIPIPFGYVNEVSGNTTGVRHEDHFGHKIYREHFEAAYGNSAEDGTVVGAGVFCHALLKLHQGTHSDDGLANHLHEATAHVDCTGTANFPASRIHVSTLVGLGKPGSFSNTCSNYPVPGQIGSGENNAPSGMTPTFSSPVAMSGPSRIATSISGSGHVDGERIIPGAACVRTYQSSNDPQYNKYKFGHDMMETWVRPMMITSPDGTNPIMFLKSYYSVLNSSRVFVLQNGQVVTQATVDACRTPPTGGSYPTTPSVLCQQVLNDTSITRYSVNSPYNGTIRNVNFKGLGLYNGGANTPYIYTDPFGRKSTTQTNDPTTRIKQYVETVNNYWFDGTSTNSTVNQPGQGLAATIAIPDSTHSVKVCRPSSGNYPHNLLKSDPCYWYDAGDLKFAKEWFRDYSNSGDKIHAPN